MKTPHSINLTFPAIQAKPSYAHASQNRIYKESEAFLSFRKVKCYLIFIVDGRRVTIAEPIKPVLKSALTKNTKGRVSEPEKRSTRLILDEDDEDEDGIDEDVDESQETNR